MADRSRPAARPGRDQRRRLLGRDAALDRAGDPGRAGRCRRRDRSAAALDPDRGLVGLAGPAAEPGLDDELAAPGLRAGRRGDRDRIRRRSPRRCPPPRAAPPDRPTPRSSVAAGLDDRRWAWIDPLDHLQARALSLALGVAWIVGAIVFVPYAALRALPVKALRDAVGLRQLDSFLVDWFGDMRILLHDPAQAANIRAQLVGAIGGLVARGCGPIVVVAHSGGAVVSFTTLTDPGLARLPVTKLITLGQGLDLAWELENAWCGLPQGDRLTPKLGTVGWPARWVDFWATYDPATGGPLTPPDGVDARPVEMPVRNRMSLLDDHGTYWENDEEFLIPLLRQLDTPDGPPSRSRFFRDRLSELVRVERRRQRVGVLAAWRWVCLVGAGVALGGATLHAALLHGDRLRRLGETVAHAWGSIPGGSLLASPIDWVAGLVHWPGWLPTLGEWLLGVALVSLAFVILARIGIGRWVGWDERERWLGRSEPPRPTERRGVAIEVLALVTGAAVLALLVALT